MRAQTLLVGNWKMNLGIAASREMAEVAKTASLRAKKCEIWLAPSSVCIPEVINVSRGSTIHVGAQNVHGAEKGAFTGELSVSMLREAGCSFAITGHSERRHVFGESSKLCAERTAGALKAGLCVIFCVGEKLESRASGKTMQVIEEQLAPLFDSIDKNEFSSLIIAYEPVWAIGTGKVATPHEIDETHLQIAALWSKATSAEAPAILYGGSVDPDNVGSIVTLKSVAGCLIGGASIHPQKFSTIVEIAEKSAA